MINILLKGWNYFQGRKENVHVSGHALYSIDFEHAMTHEGRGFQYSNKSTVGANSFYALLLQSDSGCYTHFRSMELAVSGGPITGELYENCAVSSVGASVNGSIINANRNSSRASCLHGYRGPVITTTGDLIDTLYIPAGRRSGGFGAAPVAEIILEPDASYLLFVSNENNAAVTVGERFYWYSPESI